MQQLKDFEKGVRGRTSPGPAKTFAVSRLDHMMIKPRDEASKLQWYLLEPVTYFSHPAWASQGAKVVKFRMSLIFA